MWVQAIVNELRGEKIEIVRWSANPAESVSNALSPAKVTRGLKWMKNRRIAIIVVLDNQLFQLAHWQRGQNARLAAKLTGWKIDIRSES